MASGETVGGLLSGSIRAVLSRWTALRLAVTHGDARDAAAIADALLADAVALALAPAARAGAEEYLVLFEDTFERLGTDVEDGSFEEVAAALVRLRDAAVAGRLDVLRAESVKGDGTAVGESLFQGGSTSGSDEESGDYEEMGDVAEKAEPEVDGEGFTVVRRQTRSMTRGR